MARIGSLTFALIAFLIAPSASAFDIESIDLLWLFDAVNETPIPNPWGLEMDVFLSDETGLGDIEVTAPGGIGTFSLTNFGGGEWAVDLGQTTQYATSGALFTDYPTGTWTIDFLDAPGGSVVDTVDLALAPSVVTDFIDVTDPTHLTTVALDQDVTWSDCSLCGGNAVGVFLLDVATDTDLNQFGTTDKSGMTWDPGPLPGNTDLEIEAILGDYDFLGAPLTTDTLNDPFSMIGGFENINIIQFSTVPEPGTGLLVGLGLLGLGLRGRSRS